MVSSNSNPSSQSSLHILFKIGANIHGLLDAIDAGEFASGHWHQFFGEANVLQAVECACSGNDISRVKSASLFLDEQSWFKEIGD